MKKLILGLVLMCGCDTTPDKPKVPVVTNVETETPKTRLQIIERSTLNDSIYGPYVYIIKDKETNHEFIVVETGHGLTMNQTK
jgi:hypothetical protein